MTEKQEDGAVFKGSSNRSHSHVLRTPRALAPLAFPYLCPDIDKTILSRPGGIDSLQPNEILRTASNSIRGFSGLEITVYPESVMIAPVEAIDKDHRGRVNLTNLTPRDVLKLNMLPFLRVLERVRIKVLVRQSGKRIGRAPGLRRKLRVSALTALAILMKAHGCLPAVAKVFSVSPSAIAMDIRYYGLGQAIGTMGARYILSCMFQGMQAKNWLPNQIQLICASTDVYYSQLEREDHRRLIRDGDMTDLYEKFRGLFDLRDLIGLEDGPVYARFAMMRDGIAFGAMRCFAKDVDRHNDLTQMVVSTFANALVGLGQEVAVFAMPVGGSLASQMLGTIGSFVTSLVEGRIRRKWVEGAVDQAIVARFDLVVTELATRGHVTGFSKQMATEDAMAYASGAGKIVEYVSSRVPPSTLDVYR